MKLYPALVARPARAAPAFVDLVLASLDGTGVSAVEEAGDGSVRAFFADTPERDRVARQIAETLSADVITLEVSDEDWAARSQASVTAIRVGTLTVAPPWDIPSGGGDVIVILPSMGFGTGHHATTRLCLTALQSVPVAGASVLDVGTGSGVLALAAAKLGASRVAGIDNDPDAIANALENRELNQLHVDFRCERLEDTKASGGKHDVLLANLTGAVLARNARTLLGLTAPGGRLILSGLREEEEQQVLGAFEAKVEARESEDGWVCLVLGPEA